jgi:AAHS family 4-hydroxybenzoate transporter-like MFS transporter
MEEWSVARSAFAPILALSLAGMALGGTLGGMVGDRIGRRNALIGCVLTFAILTAAMALVNGMTSLATLRFFAGVGLGGALPNAAALSSEFVPRKHRPFAVTLTIVCIPLGATLAGLLGIRILPELGWRGLFLVGGLIPLAMGLILIWLLPESPRFLARQPHRWQRLSRLLGRMGHTVPANATYVDTEERATERPSVRELFASGFRRDSVALWIAFFACLHTFYLSINWIPSMLTGAGFDPSFGSAGIMAFNLGGVVGAIAGSVLMPRLGSKPIMLSMGAGTVLGALALSVIEIGPGFNTTLLFGLLLFTGGLLNALQVTLYALAAHIYPTAVRATGVGSAASVGRIGGLLSTFVGAWALDLAGPKAFFTVFAIAVTVTMVALAMVRRHIRRT